MLGMYRLQGSLAAVVLLAASTTTWAQSDSNIAGVVKDTTGAVLPGVTVEASSPALIEKVRSVITDNEGQYKIINLRPGVYTVSFAIAGVAPVKRENVELPSAF